MSELFTNNASTSLASGIASGATSLTVSSGDGSKFPSPSGGDFFRLTLFKKSTGEIEICKCTSRSSDVLTISRAQESTTALDFNAGDIVELRPTAATFDSITFDAQDVREGTYTYANDTGGANSFVISVTDPPGSYAAGQRFEFKAAATNTGGCTLNVNSLGNKSVVYPNGSALQAGEISTGQMVQVIYDGSKFLLLSAPGILRSTRLAPTGSSSNLDADKLDGQHGSYYNDTPNGTSMVFIESSTPSGWTFNASGNDRVLLRTSTLGEGGTTGGNWAISGLTVQGHTLTTSQMPSHSHGDNFSIASNGNHTHSVKVSYGQDTVPGGGAALVYSTAADNIQTTANYVTESTAGSHSHTLNGSVSSNGGGGSHNHGIRTTEAGDRNIRNSSFAREASDVQTEIRLLRLRELPAK